MAASLSLFPHFACFTRCRALFPIPPSRASASPPSCGRLVLVAASRAEVLEDGVVDVGEVSRKKRTPKSSKRSPAMTRKKAPPAPGGEEESDEASPLAPGGEDASPSASAEDAIPKPRRGRKKGTTAASPVALEEKPKKSRGRRKTRFREDDAEDAVVESDFTDGEDSASFASPDDDSDEDIDLGTDEGEDVSYTYGWPPLVCCFGAAQHAFVPSGRRANRLLDYEIHDRMRDALWEPEKFVRAPGGSAGSVAIALASLGGKVAVMGKLGDDDYGHAMLYYLNVNNVQTRSIRMDSKRLSASSLMRISKRGRLKMSCVKPCAEDSLSKSEIKLDVLKEAKMFYINSHSLLEKNMRSTALQAIRISKKLGGLIFYDVNLPMPLWHSVEETRAFIQKVWELADIIEVTKQELEFLCQIKPFEEFDTRNNSRDKFVHYERDAVAPLWHDNLKILFVTNGTSKVHYYTKEDEGAINGMEDPHLTPYSADMSTSGDGIVAGLMRMLTVQPHLINDKGYLEHSIRFAMNCGVIDQWAAGVERGFPPKDYLDDLIPDINGIKSLTEREYRTLPPDGS
ncbi:hypothetical protein MLD38_005532 [Melastoma candidum]|uniref:Uncharacterized protein n=1 Tax=Melastoma candidum TaxID=119954 RepID=A0ACB9RN03_9MYRT|nr:hypothetical protein MLD38_005532 [Melastoma candidum]